MMHVHDIPIVFDCEGQQLVGMVHLPAEVRTRGMLSIVAGGPQYRGGVCRLQVQMARSLAAQGTPVMRFDYRGLGDSEGLFRGFIDVESDLRRAIDAFLAHVPGMREVVLWGGCDAASAVLINAWKCSPVTGIVLGNPWVHSEDTSTTVEMQHYSKRWKDPALWRKVIGLQYNPLPALRTILRSLRKRVAGPAPGARDATLIDDPSAPFVARMLQGMLRFKGDVLLLVSGRSMISREFDVLVQQSVAWQQAMRSLRHCARCDLPDADQAFSTLPARTAVIEATGQWLRDVRAPLASGA